MQNFKRKKSQHTTNGIRAHRSENNGNDTTIGTENSLFPSRWIMMPIDGRSAVHHRTCPSLSCPSAVFCSSVFCLSVFCQLCALRRKTDAGNVPVFRERDGNLRIIYWLSRTFRSVKMQDWFISCIESCVS